MKTKKVKRKRVIYKLKLQMKMLETSDLVLHPVKFGLPEDDDKEDDSFIKRKLSAPIDPMTQSFYGEESIFCSAPDVFSNTQKEIDDKTMEFEERSSDIPKVTSMTQLEQDQSSTFDVGESRKPFADDYSLGVKGEHGGIKEDIYTTVDRLDLVGTEEVKRLEVDVKSDRSNSRSSNTSANLKALSSSSEDEIDDKEVNKKKKL
uniref:Uncharacterized protein n=1 Tax=Strigamia maritima TaxID=126957 RepID=T1IZ69_STRMM